MPRNDHEVFQRLSEDAETPVEVDFIAYAMFAYQKKEWIVHHEKQTGNPPSQADIDTWISNISDWQFGAMHKEAVDFFDAAARAYLEDEIARIKQEALETAIVKKVEAAGAFWKQMALALVTSILAPILLGAIIAGAFAWEKMPTASEISSKITGKPVEAPPAPKADK